MADAAAMVRRCRLHGSVTSVPLGDLTADEKAQVEPEHSDQYIPYGQNTLPAGEEARPDHIPLTNDPEVER